MKKTALVILAAGIGSRYGGGIKQMTPIGPGGEIMMDYAVYDALEAGFNKVVFIIRKDLDRDFRELIGDRISAVTETAYAYQEIDDLPEGFSVPEGRTKPWGTGQALLAAADVIEEPFVVINADDYYGKSGFRALHSLLVGEEEKADGRHALSMAAFRLGNTLSDHGGVTRGILETADDGSLLGITETKNIIRTESGAGISTNDGVKPVSVECGVSMNMWGMHPAFLRELKDGFPEFLRSGGDPMKKEYLLPEIIDRMLKEGKVSVKALPTDDVWFGMTYREDLPQVQAEIAELVRKGVYRSPLFPKV